MQHYNGTQHYSAETILLIFPFLQTIKLSFPATTQARSAVGPSLSLAQRSGTHCQTSSATHRYRLTVSVASLKHSCLQTRSSVHSALEIFLLMRYINLRLLTYLLTYQHHISDVARWKHKLQTDILD